MGAVIPFQVIVDTIQQQGPHFDQLLRAGKNVLSTSEPGPDKEVLELKLMDTTKRWDVVKKKASERQDLLEAVLPLTKTFHGGMESFKHWLVVAENQLHATEPYIYEPKSVDKHLNSLCELKKELENRWEDLGKLEEASISLSDLCYNDKFVIQGEVQDVKGRCEKLSVDISSLQDKLLSISKTLDQYSKAKEPVEELLNRAQNYIEACEPTGLNADKGRDQLNSVEALLTSLKDCETDVNTACEAAVILEAALGPKSLDLSRVKHDVEYLTQRHKNIQEDLQGIRVKLEKDVETATQFCDTLDNLNEWFVNMQEAVASQEPISGDLQIVRKQLQQVEVCHVVNIIVFKHPLKNRLAWQM